MMSAGTRVEFVRYLVVGAVNTVVTYALFVAAMHVMTYLLAYSGAYAAGIAIGYALQSRFVFRVPIQWRTALRFPLAYVVQYVAGAALLWLLVDYLAIARGVAALIVVAATVPLGFALNRLALREGARRGVIRPRRSINPGETPTEDRAASTPTRHIPVAVTSGGSDERDANRR